MGGNTGSWPMTPPAFGHLPSFAGEEVYSQ
jgi:hypothetical protein